MIIKVYSVVMFFLPLLFGVMGLNFTGLEIQHIRTRIHKETGFRHRRKMTFNLAWIFYIPIIGRVIGWW